MVPFSHVLWASVWLGIATDAVRRARLCVRTEARKKPGTIPASATRLAELTVHLHLMRALLRDALDEYERRMHDPDALASLVFSVRMNNLKIAASEAVVEIASRALRIAGIAGYRNDSELSLGRHVRDAHSAAIMILNERLYATNAALLLAVREE
jgi:acyl-CoA dehydrogenase